jgi:dolichol-phosphate mannosyltransferase
MQERNRFVRGLFAWVGFKSVGVEHERPPRFGGESKAHSLKVLDLASKGILAHSYVPLRLITFTGLLLFAISVVGLAVAAVQFVVYGVPFPGFGSIIGLMLAMFGLVFLFLGVMSEYIALIYEEVKQRPNYVVRHKEGL